MLNELKIKKYLATKPVLRAWLFGSQADGTATDNSDVDILLEFDHTQPVGLQYVQIWMDLQEIIGKKVDLVTTGGISPHIKPFIDAQKILVYERG
jgi:predicted nucleotidyltransferase